jgi:transcriptional regulator with XRE-family HTH domain
MNTTFGEFIRQTREAHHFTQAECATALGYEHRSSIHRLEKGEREWTLGNITDFAGLLDLPVSELLQAFERKG